MFCCVLIIIKNRVQKPIGKRLNHSYASIDLFTDTAAILDSIVSNSYYGMLRGQISMYLPPEHPIIDI